MNLPIFYNTIFPLCRGVRNVLWIWASVMAFAECQAQTEPAWRHDFGRQIEWCQLYKEHGLYFAYGQNELTLFDLQTREVIWNQVFVGAKADRLKIADDFPLVWISGLNSTKKTTKTKRLADNNRSVLVSVFTGDILVDTDTYEIDKIEDLLPYYDSKCLVIKGKNEGNRVLALARFGEVGLQWMVPEPARLKKITLNDKFDLGPVVGDDHLIFAYADTLFGMSIKDGSVLWKEHTGTGLYGKPAVKYLVPKPVFAERHHDDFYVTERLGNDYFLKKYGMADKREPLDSPMVLGNQYNIQVLGKDLLVQTKHTFNYLDPATGAMKWISPPTITDEVSEVYPQNDGYLVWVSKGETGTASHGLLWVNHGPSLTWNAPCWVNGAELRFIRRFDDRLVYITDKEAGMLDFNTGASMVKMPLAAAGIFAVDEARKDLLIYQEKDLFRLSSANAKFERVIGQIVFSGDNETPHLIRAVDGGYALSSNRNLWFVTYEGQVRYKKYIKELGLSDKARKVMITVAVVATAVIFSDELAQLNALLYQSGLRGGAETAANAGLTISYNKSVSALVASAYMQRFMEGRSGKRSMAGAAALNNLWLVSDKLDNDKFGLRVFDVKSGEQIREVWLDDKKDFKYNLLSSEQGVLFRNNNAIFFYQL